LLVERKSSGPCLGLSFLNNSFLSIFKHSIEMDIIYRLTWSCHECFSDKWSGNECITRHVWEVWSYRAWDTPATNQICRKLHFSMFTVS
jgi:hypothetical protein